RFFDGRRTGASGSPWADAQVFRTRIRRNIRLAECPSFGQSIFQYAPSSRGAEDYASLAAEIQGRAPAAIWQGAHVHTTSGGTTAGGGAHDDAPATPVARS